jgi:hypothetical protein
MILESLALNVREGEIVRIGTDAQLCRLGKQ